MKISEEKYKLLRLLVHYLDTDRNNRLTALHYTKENGYKEHIDIEWSLNWILSTYSMYDFGVEYRHVEPVHIKVEYLYERINHLRDFYYKQLVRDWDES